MVLCFGMARIHVFDNETNKWSALTYDFDESSTT